MKKKIYSSLIFLLFVTLTISTAQSLTKNIFQPLESKQNLGLRTQENWTEQQELLSSDRAVWNDFSVIRSIDKDTAFIGTIGDDDTRWISESANVFTREMENNPPFIPSNSSPANGSINQLLVIYFLWIGGDPDPGDLVTYDVYFGTSNPPPKVVSNQTPRYYFPGVLEYSKTYYWKIVSWDDHGAWTVGPIWHFTTILDTALPVTTHILTGTMGNNSWYISDVIITLNALDNQSGVNHTYYKLDTGNWSEYNGSIIVHEDGILSLEYYSIDKAGNIEPVKGPFSFKLDQTRPTITITKQQINLFEIKFIAEVSDATSGVAYAWFVLDGVLQFNDTQSPYEWTWTGLGNHTMTAIGYDIAGNREIQSMSTPVEQIQGIKSIQLQITPQFLERGLRNQLLM